MSWNVGSVNQVACITTQNLLTKMIMPADRPKSVSKMPCNQRFYNLLMFLHLRVWLYNRFSSSEHFPSSESFNLLLNDSGGEFILLLE